MRYEEHCSRCLKMFGEEFGCVHRWLDELAHVPSAGNTAWYFDEDDHRGPLNPYHRKFRHNRVGIGQVRTWWGDEAAAAAELHIMDDLSCKLGEIPLDERDYVKKGFV